MTDISAAIGSIAGRTSLPRLVCGTLAFSLAALIVSPPASAQLPDDAGRTVQFSGDQMLAVSEKALAEGREDAARAILKALTRDPHLQLRNEARFRLAMLEERRKDLRQAAVWLRAILDEEPAAPRVRFELARVLSALGDVDAARRELRQVQSARLPPEVIRMIDRFSAALREFKGLGGDLEIAFAPDSNINRATRADTLGTVIGDFQLDESAKARSGLGLALRASGYTRFPVSDSLRIVARGSFDGSFYRQASFDDLMARIAAGPEIRLPAGRLQAQARYERRWYGGTRFSDTVGGEIVYERPVGPTAHVRVTADLSRTDVVPNPLQDATSIALSLAVEKALSPRSGVSLTIVGARQLARDRAYSSWFGQAGVFGWRELGKTTLVASASYSVLGADERLALYPEARNDDGVRLMAGATLRQLTVSGFAPQVRVIWERNGSSIELYRYSRLRAEIGVVRAF